MNCPVCGKEMERGVLYTELGRGLFFLPPVKKWDFGTQGAAWNSAAGSFLMVPIIYRGAIARLYTAMSVATAKRSYWSIADMDLWTYEREQWNSGFTALCGVDEAGAGPLAGPVYAAAVILPRKWRFPASTTPRS